MKLSTMAGLTLAPVVAAVLWVPSGPALYGHDAYARRLATDASTLCELGDSTRFGDQYLVNAVVLTDQVTSGLRGRFDRSHWPDDTFVCADGKRVRITGDHNFAADVFRARD